MNASRAAWILPCLAACALPPSVDAADKPDKKVIAFFKAVREGNLPGIQEAVRKKVNLNVLDENDNTALCIAASAGKAEVADSLLKAGAQVDQRNGGGATPLMLAAREGHAASCSPPRTAGSTSSASCWTPRQVSTPGT